MVWTHGIFLSRLSQCEACLPYYVIYVHASVSVSVYVCVSEFVCVSVCMCVCVPMHICVHVYGMCCNGAYR